MSERGLKACTDAVQHQETGKREEKEIVMAS